MQNQYKAMAITDYIKKTKEIPLNTGIILLIILATPIWLPICIWKIGIVFADNIVKKFVNA